MAPAENNYQLCQQGTSNHSSIFHSKHCPSSSEDKYFLIYCQKKNLVYCVHHHRNTRLLNFCFRLTLKVTSHFQSNIRISRGSQCLMLLSVLWEWHFIKEWAIQWPWERIADDADTVNCWRMIVWTWKLILQLGRACRSAVVRYRIMYDIKKGKEARGSTMTSG